MQQAENFKDYITDFEKRLEIVDADVISGAPYIRKYLAHLLLHKRYYLSIYADVLSKLLQHSSKDKAGILLVDFGAGNGMLGMFAKFCGFNRVFLNDIDPKFIDASKKLSAHIKIEMDGYITGDVSAVQAYFKNNPPDAVIGTDVIEHIYSLGSFLHIIRDINQSMVSVFTTASNPCNYFKVSLLKRMQLKDELEGGTPDDNIFFGESPSAPFLELRAEIIRKKWETLPSGKVLALAKATRGMIEQDIEAAVEQYNLSGELPVPAHGNNTCDPFSGCWTERILSIKEYIFLYRSAGFKINFYNGFYNVFETGVKRYLKKILNSAIAIFGNRVAPYIIIVGYDNKDGAVQ